MNSENQTMQAIRDGEDWLSGFGTPGPSAAAIERAKLAARGELSRRGSGRTVRRWAAWHGVLAAAASIALAVTVGWYSTHVFDSPVGGVAVADLVPAWSDDVTEEFARYDALDEELSEFETWVKDENWALSGSSLYDTLEGAWENTANGDDAGETGASLWPRRPTNDVREVT